MYIYTAEGSCNDTVYGSEPLIVFCLGRKSLSLVLHPNLQVTNPSASKNAGPRSEDGDTR